MNKLIGFLILSVSISVNSLAEVAWDEFPVALDNPYGNEVEFGHINVPETRGASDSRDIYVAFTRIKSTSAQPASDAIIFLPGGPGGSYTSMVNHWLSSENVQQMLKKRDIILFDPRGVGYSYPRLCDELNSYKNFYDSTLLSGTQWQAALAKRMQACATILETDNVDIHSYNSNEIANDIEDLRKALGYEQWNIRGHSYGANFGFILMQQYPERVRSAFLSSIIALDLDYNHSQINAIRSIYKVIASCEDDPVCNAKYPDLENKIVSLMQQLEESPVAITLPNETGEITYTYELGPQVMMSGLFSLMYSRKGLEILPAFIYGLSEASDWIIKNMAPMLLRPGLIDRDMTTIVWSNDLDPANRPSKANNLEQNKLYKSKWMYKEVEERKQAFDIIRTQDVIPEYNWKVVDIPTLILFGDYDPAAPPTNADLLLTYLSNARHHVIPTTGHDAHTFHFPDFYENPDPNTNVSELTTDKKLTFVTNLTLNEGVGSTMSKVATGNIAKLWLPVLSILLALVSFLYLSANILFSKVKKREDPNRPVKLKLWLLAFSVCFVTAIIGAAVISAVTVNPFTAALGLTGRWYLLDAAYVLLGIVLLTVLLQGNKLWYPKLRILSVINLFSAIGFSVFLIGSGFI